MEDGTFVSPSACRVDAIDDTDQVPRRSQHHMSNRRNASPASRPHFMTQGMWFAWLLRGDIRQGSARPMIRKHSGNLLRGGCFGDGQSIPKCGTGGPIRQSSQCNS